jgi:hypothetical protein
MTSTKLAIPKNLTEWNFLKEDCLLPTLLLKEQEFLIASQITIPKGALGDITIIRQKTAI